MLELVLLCLAIILTAVVLYLAVRFITGEEPFEFSYMLRLLVAATVVVVVAPAFQSATASFSFIAPLGTILAFIIILYVVRAVLIDPITGSDEWTKAIWVSLVAVILIYLLSAMVYHFLGRDILPLPF